MALDTRRKRAAAATVGPPINAPSIVPDGSLTSIDRYQIGWSIRVSAFGTLIFYGTTLGSGVSANVFTGVTFDDSGNLRASGDIFEGSAV